MVFRVILTILVATGFLFWAVIVFFCGMFAVLGKATGKVKRLAAVMATFVCCNLIYAAVKILRCLLEN